MLRFWLFHLSKNVNIINCYVEILIEASNIKIGKLTQERKKII